MFGLFNKISDPVCGMKLDKNKAKFSEESGGVKYSFCSENCKNKFNTNPKDYAKKTCCG